MEIVNLKDLEFKLAEAGRKMSSGISGEEYNEVRRQHSELKRKYEFYTSQIPTSDKTIAEALSSLNNIAGLAFGLCEEYDQAISALQHAKQSTEELIKILSAIALSSEDIFQVIESSLAISPSKKQEDEVPPVVKRLQELAKKRKGY